MRTNQLTDRKRRLVALCLTVFLAQMAIAQRVVIDKQSIDCGRTGYMKPVTATFELTNKGPRRLNITSVKADCGCTQVDVPKKRLGNGDKTTIAMTYDGRMLGHYVKQVAIYTDATDKPIYLAMKGIVAEKVEDYTGSYPYQIGKMLADVQALEFDNVNKGDEPQQVIHIMNNGTTELTPNMQHLPPYLTAIFSPEKLRPGQRGQVTLTLHSSQIHGYGLTQASVYLAGKLGEKVRAANELPVSVVALPAQASTDSGNRQDAPRMELTADTIRLGMVDGKMKTTETIVLSNTGRSPLSISSVQMFTSGLKLTVGKRELQPGEQTKMKVTADRAKLLKAKTKPRILMITNDPDHAKVVIAILVK